MEAIQKTTNTEVSTVKTFFGRDDVKKKFEEILGKRSNAFLSSVLSLCMQNDKLKSANPESVYMCAMMAATLDLPINSNLGMAYIIPYNDKDKGQVAQFQLGYKGLTQLALRSGQFKTIAAEPIYDGQLISENPLTGYVFDFTKKQSDKVVGYASYFSLLNGFEKTKYMTVEQVQAHGKKYSKSFSYNSSPWKTDFDAMALKTVLKLLLSKYAPLSVEMQKAVIADQSVINDVETMDIEYTDAGEAEITAEQLQELFDLKILQLTDEDRGHAKRIIDTKETKSYAKLLDTLKKL